MRTPRPYNETKEGSTVLREFTENVNSDELIWHQDRNDRRVTVIECKQWQLQLEKGLPFQLIEGNTYDIPANTWHRVIKGIGNLRIKIVEKDANE